MSENAAFNALVGAGWSPGRCTSIELDLAVLEEEGYSIFPSVVRVLEEYSGLVLATEADDEIRFSSAHVCQIIYRERVDDYSDRAGVRLVPVGLTGSGMLVLMVGEDGRWFGGFDEAFGLVGDDKLDALSNLLTGPPLFKQEL